MSFLVRFLPSGKEFTAEKNETVLEAALRSGISLNYSCNNGSCGGCGGSSRASRRGWSGRTAYEGCGGEPSARDRRRWWWR
mgnify:CR=1 FL=1